MARFADRSSRVGVGALGAARLIASDEGDESGGLAVTVRLSREGGQRGGSQVHASPARALQSGELKNDDHQNDDHQHTDNGADNSPVHGQNLLSRHWVPAYCWCKTCGRWWRLVLTISSQAPLTCVDAAVHDGGRNER